MERPVITALADLLRRHVDLTPRRRRVLDLANMAG
jgi:hypothetical protein